MKESLRHLFFLAFFVLSAGSVAAQGGASKGHASGHTAFDNVGIGIEASTTGFGISAAMPVHRAIPRGRIGFRTEAGVLFHGKPSISSPNMVGQTPAIELAGFNKFLSNWKVCPVLSLKMIVKIGKNQNH
ncbi:hypothetical protein [uncultured Alistipes sp.]|uniref:hypothetical protein n=1 Tax=uncultured Alistipes sp. TaxID=538949 RepID=UPI002616ED0C|nr:hypothetical protein [uncultured Alistipes sp.]